MHIPRREPDRATIQKLLADAYDCAHSQTERRRWYAANGVLEIRLQCLRCGKKAGALRQAKFTPAEIAAMPAWDAQLPEDYHQQQTRHYQAELEHVERQLHIEWTRDYDAYLHSDEWRRKRELVMQRAQGLCEGCREVEATDVHHLTYDDAGVEFLFQLVALCRPCHERWHGHLQPAASVRPPAPAPAASTPGREDY